MSFLAFFYPVIRALSQGRIIRQVTSWVLRLASLLSVVFGFVVIVLMLKGGFNQDTPTTLTVALVILAVFVLGGTFAVAQIYWYRSDSVLELEDSPFTVIPVTSLVLRCLGEVYATSIACVGLGGCIFLWITGYGPWGVLSTLHEWMPLPKFSFDSAFLFGLAFLVQMALLAFVMLIVFYFLAEIIVVLVDIAMTLRKGLPAAGARLEAGRASFACPKCHSEQVPGSTFCDVCGERLA